MDDAEARTQLHSRRDRDRPRVVERLLADHVEQVDGRCVMCGGNGRPAPRRPCGVADLAIAAQRLRGA